MSSIPENNEDYPQSRDFRNRRRFQATTKELPGITQSEGPELMAELARNLAPLGKASAWIRQPYKPRGLKDLVPVSSPPESG